MRSPAIRLIGAFALALGLTGCATVNVNSYLERGIDLRQYRTYNWAPVGERSTGDPRLDNNRFFQERVETAIEEQLRARGFEKADDPDVLIRFHADVTQEIYVSDGRPEVLEAGTLLVDIVDARSNRLVWRGWAKSGVDGVVDDQAWMEQRIDEAVARILQRL